MGSLAETKKEQAAQSMLRDILWLLNGTMEDADIQRYRTAEPEMDGEQLVELLRRNFSTLDPDNNGISRQELATALMTPQKFGRDEYAMLQLVGKFFDTVINLSDDEPGDETVITHTDGDVLAQFLIHSKMTLSQLHRWIALKDGTATEKDIGPPPLSDSQNVHPI